jgi:hypothetical protein
VRPVSIALVAETRRKGPSGPPCPGLVLIWQPPLLILLRAAHCCRNAAPFLFPVPLSASGSPLWPQPLLPCLEWQATHSIISIVMGSGLLSFESLSLSESWKQKSRRVINVSVAAAALCRHQTMHSNIHSNGKCTPSHHTCLPTISEVFQRSYIFYMTLDHVFKHNTT